MRKTIVGAVSLFLSLAVAGQAAAQPDYAPEQSAVAYALVHGGYLGQAIVEVLSDGSLDVEIDEAFLPHTLTAVDMNAVEWSEANTAYYVLRGKPVYVAKYIEYDGTVYVGTTVGNSLTYVEAGESGEAVGTKDLELLILKNQSTMAAYFDNVQNGSLKVLTGFKGEAKAITTTKFGAVTKDASPKYWDFGQTWIGNVNAIEKFVEENGSAYNLSDMKRGKDKTWSVVDGVTGATNIDFKDYFTMVQLAVSQLKYK